VSLGGQQPHVLKKLQMAEAEAELKHLENWRSEAEDGHEHYEFTLITSLID
jgi:hypothetical protein